MHNLILGQWAPVEEPPKTEELRSNEELIEGLIKAIKDFKSQNMLFAPEYDTHLKSLEEYRINIATGFLAEEPTILKVYNNNLMNLPEGSSSDSALMEVWRYIYDNMSLTSILLDLPEGYYDLRWDEDLLKVHLIHSDRPGLDRDVSLAYFPKNALLPRNDFGIFQSFTGMHGATAYDSYGKLWSSDAYSYTQPEEEREVREFREQNQLAVEMTQLAAIMSNPDNPAIGFYVEPGLPATPEEQKIKSMPITYGLPLVFMADWTSANKGISEQEEFDEYIWGISQKIRSEQIGGDSILRAYWNGVYMELEVDGDKFPAGFLPEYYYRTEGGGYDPLTELAKTIGIDMFAYWVPFAFGSYGLGRLAPMFPVLSPAASKFWSVASPILGGIGVGSAICYDPGMAILGYCMGAGDQREREWASTQRGLIEKQVSITQEPEYSIFFDIGDSFETYQRLSIASESQSVRQKAEAARQAHNAAVYSQVIGHTLPLSEEQLDYYESMLIDEEFSPLFRAIHSSSYMTPERRSLLNLENSLNQQDYRQGLKLFNGVYLQPSSTGNFGFDINMDVQLGRNQGGRLSGIVGGTELSQQPNISVEVESVNDHPLDERVLEEMLCEIFAEYSNQ